MNMTSGVSEHVDLLGERRWLRGRSHSVPGGGSEHVASLSGCSGCLMLKSAAEGSDMSVRGEIGDGTG